MRMRRKPNLRLRIDKCASLLISEPTTLRGRWLEEFPFRELNLELGCGKGRFTVETAKNVPEALLVGLEKIENVIVIALERTINDDIKNVRYIQNLADDLTAFFAPNEVSKIYLNFSDPWPSRKHIKRRLTSRDFLDLYKNVLSPGGEIHMKTDNLPLFEFSLEELDSAGFERLHVTRDLHKDGPVGVMTDYEMKFHEHGVKINQCIVRKTS